MRTVAGVIVVTLLAASACSPQFTGKDAGAGAGGKAAGGASGARPSSGTSAGGRAGGGAAAGDGDGGDWTDAGAGGMAGALVIGGVAGVGGVGGVGTGGGGEPAVDFPQQGLVLWLRADRGVSHVGGVVERWTDSSGHGVEAAQTATNYRPKLVADALAGKAAVVFDGVDDYLKLPELDADFSGGASIVYAGAPSRSQECEGIFEASNGAEQEDLHLGRWQGFALYEVGNEYLHAVDYPIVLDAPEVLMGVQQASGQAALRRNSFGLGERVFPTPAATSRAEVYVGRSLYASCTRFAGAMGELLIYARALSDDEVVQLEGYLQGKWGCCRD